MLWHSNFDDGWLWQIGSPTRIHKVAHCCAYVVARRPKLLTVEQFVSIVSEQQTSVSWEKLSDTEWVATLKNADKVSGKPIEMKAVFAVVPNEKAVVLWKRLVVNGREGGEGDIAMIVSSATMKMQMKNP